MFSRLRCVKREEALPLLSKVVHTKTTSTESLPSSTKFASSYSFGTEVDEGSQEDGFNGSHFGDSYNIQEIVYSSESDANISFLFPSSSDRRNVEDDTSTMGSISDWTDGSALYSSCRAASIDSCTVFDEVSAIYSYSSDQQLAFERLSRGRTGADTSVGRSTIYTHHSGHSLIEPSRRQRLGGNEGAATGTTGTTAVIIAPPDRIISIRPIGHQQFDHQLSFSAFLPIPKVKDNERTVVADSKNKGRRLVYRVFSCFRQAFVPFTPAGERSLVSMSNEYLSLSTVAAVDAQRQWI